MNEYTNSTNAERGRSRSGFVNALLGAVVMTVFSWIPFAPVVGGALSGYLDAGDRRGEGAASRRGIRIGALAGLLATVPAVLVLAFVGSIVTVGWFGMSMGGGMGPRVALGLPLFAWALVTFVLVLALVYHVALSALGGWLGAELAAREDRPRGATPTSDGPADASERRVEHGEAERDHGSRADRESPETADRDADEDDAADAGDGRSER
jgi:heme/copper-type cytochrome/quinol oxidase subunit 4